MNKAKAKKQQMLRKCFSKRAILGAESDTSFSKFPEGKRKNLTLNVHHQMQIQTCVSPQEDTCLDLGDKHCFPEEGRHAKWNDISIEKSRH